MILKWTVFFLVIFSFPKINAAVYELKLKDAEEAVLGYSNNIKSSVASEDSALEKAESQYVSLFPKLSLEGNYQYNFTLPEFKFEGQEPVIFGTTNVFNIGPYVSYTLWDSHSLKNTYEASTLTAAAKGEDKKNTYLVELRNVREAYTEVQRGIEELRLTNETLDLSRDQRRDIKNRYKNGAASRLDVVASEREVLGYEIQFQKRQAELSLTLQDLLALIGKNDLGKISKPGPPSIKGVSLVLKFDPIEKSVKEELRKQIPPPDENHPQLKSLENQARSADLSASTYRAKQYPTLKLYGAIYYTQPPFPNPIKYWQEFAGVTFTMPLFVGDPAPKQAAEQRNIALAAEYKRSQLNVDMKRDFAKVKTNLESLFEQKTLAEKDVSQSKKAAKLYYSAYQAGKVDFLEVQNANVKELEAKVNLTRIGIQILNSITLLKSLSGTEIRYE